MVSKDSGWFQKTRFCCSVQSLHAEFANHEGDIKATRKNKRVVKAARKNKHVVKATRKN